MKQKILIKIGGLAFEKQSCFAELATAIKKMQEKHFIIVHGGGKAISQALKAANRKAEFIDGYRVTPDRDIDIVEQVLSNSVNKNICAQLEKQGIQCQSLSGRTKSLLRVKPYYRNGKSLGRVGSVQSVNPGVVQQALDRNNVPVVSPVSEDKDGLSYNVNADSAAAALAHALSCSDLIYFTDVEGIYNNGEVQPDLSFEKASRLIETGKIHGGMVAKLDSAFYALKNGVHRVHLSKWRGPDYLIKAVRQHGSIGTVIHL